jgi:putative ABC transport system permease protein
MVRLSWAGFRERWTLFIGAALTVCFGVALVQSSLVLLLSALTLEPPAGTSPLGRMRFDEANGASAALISVTLGFAALFAVFIISSTFAFTVEQRRRDMALLRLVGAGRRHIRRLMLGEAVLLGAIGAVAGVPTGLAVMAAQSRLLIRLGFLPEGFAGQWRGWVPFASIGVGIALAVVSVLVAARRAARVRPLAALRDTGEAARVMTAGRWVFGLLFGVGAIVLAALAPVGGAVGGQAMALNVSICAAIALALLGPVLVSFLARLVPGSAGGVLGMLAKANVRDNVRRSASTAAPLILLVGLLLGQAGASASFATAGYEELRRTTNADLVVETTGPGGDRIAGVPGVLGASTEISVPVAITTTNGKAVNTRIMSALVVDPAAYGRVHPGGSELSGLRAGVVAAGPGANGYSPGDRIGVRIGDTDLGPQPVVGAVPTAIGGGAALLLPRGALSADLLADAPSRTFVTVDPGADRRRVTAALAAVGTVSELDDWLTRDGANRSATSTKILVVILGVAGLYALIGVVNAVVIAAATRRREFAAARATGLTRRQVVRMALAESSIVTAIGLLLGLIAAAGTYAGVLATTAAVTGAATLDLPWRLIAAVAAGAFLVTGLTSVITSWSATRGQPVALLGAQE